MTRRDYLLLALYCLLLFGFALVSGRPLTMHESVLPQCTREMYEHGEWLVPSSGGRPWLHRPPLPHWILLSIAHIVGRCDAAWVVRIGPMLMSTITVLLAAWMAQRWRGRGFGRLTGFMLATTFQFTRYAWLAEEDSFLGAVIAATMALFVALEFPTQTENATSCAPESSTWLRQFFAWRSWKLLGFFVCLGLTNMVKGLIFGPLMTLVPLVGFLLWNFSGKRLGRYCWLWGWLAAIVVGWTWPAYVYSQYPDVMDMWLFDYGGRLNQGYIAEPGWYYFTVMPWALLPWTPVAVIGLICSARRLFKADGLFERFLWCWAVLPVLFFSIPDGKHHHYLLHCMPPWAMLSAIGLIRSRDAIATWPQRWWKRPVAYALALGVPADAVVFLLRHKLPGPDWFPQALMLAIPVTIGCIAWLLQQRSRWAAAPAFGGLLVVFCLGHLYAAEYVAHGREDWQFLRQIPERVEGRRPLYLNADLRCCLEVNRVLFYLDSSARVVHNLTFLLDNAIEEDTIYLVTLASDAEKLAKIGWARPVLQSPASRRETSPGDRLTLYELTFHRDITRYSSHVPILQQQVKQRVAGPFLGGKSPQDW